MADIFNDFPIRAARSAVYQGVSTPAGLDRWWTKTSSGTAVMGAELEFGFGAGFDWRAKVTKLVPDSEIEFELTSADSDWLGTRVGFRLEARGEWTDVYFHHTGWPETNTHWRVSCYCWAMYLRLLRRSIELGEVVPFEQRLDV